MVGMIEKAEVIGLIVSLILIAVMNVAAGRNRTEVSLVNLAMQ
jgi:hypothetical protein